MKNLTGNTGQGAIEAVITLPLLILVVSGFFWLTYRGVLFYFADYQLHEALLCVESSPLQQCKEELRQRLQGLLLLGTQSRISLIKGHSATKGEIEFDLKPVIQIKKQLKGNSL